MSNFTINRVVLVGRLTRDPELRALPSGTNVCSLRIACNSVWRDSDGDVQERPNYFDVSIYGGAADSVNRYMRGAAASASTVAWSGASGKPPSSTSAKP